MYCCRYADSGHLADESLATAHYPWPVMHPAQPMPNDTTVDGHVDQLIVTDEHDAKSMHAVAPDMCYLCGDGAMLPNRVARTNTHTSWNSR